MLEKVFIPFRGYYSSPFSRWQGSLSNVNSIELGAKTAKRWFEKKTWDPAMTEYLVFGITVGQPHQFFAGPWASALMGAGETPAVSISQACTTGMTCVYTAAMGVESGWYSTACVLLTDRCSNGPHTVWPNPMGPGGQVVSENWMIDNFNSDPNVGLKMVETAEQVAKEIGATKEQCDELSLRRYQQYDDALKNDREFQKRYMFPVEVAVSKKKSVLVEEDEGITTTSAEGLARLKPVVPGGVLSFGSQTHPADASCAFIVTTREKARDLSVDPSVSIQIMTAGYARERPGYMAAAPVPAARMALENADLSIHDIKVIKTHNPFIVNDLYMAEKLGIDPAAFNNYGCSLVYGHPQAPTAGRLIIEGIEETIQLGGGYFMWAGCAAGDTGGAIIFKVE